MPHKCPNAAKAYKLKYRAANRDKEAARAKAYYMATKEERRDILLRRTRLYQNEKRDWIQGLKIECLDCGTKYPHYILEFDHREGGRTSCMMKFAYSHGKEDIEKEIAKCDIVCANCHKARTYSRSPYGFQKERY